MELEERTSVIAFTVDINQKNPKLLDVSIQIPIPIKIVGAGGGGAAEGGREAVKVMTGSGSTISEAKQNIQKNLNQRLFFGHTRVVAISSEVAKTDISDFVDNMRRFPQIRRLLVPVIVPGRASQILEKDPKLEQIPVMYIKEMMESGAKIQLIPDISLGEFFINMSDSSIHPIMNMVTPTDNGFKWSGVAVFNGPKMVGQLNDEMVWAYMNLHENHPGGDIKIPCFDEKGKYSVFHARKAKTKVKVEKKNHQIHAYYQVDVEGDIRESECNLDFNNEEIINKIQKSAAEVYEARAKKMIQYVQKDIRADAIGLGFIVRARYPEIWRAVNWEQEFPNVQIHVTYKVNMRRFGMVIGKSR
ncbi:germination protein GerAC [Collibacillus ludicampi]|uniref:Germination protein GerAC n=1 Tax=Collibacillus ludicampi TaxID=2771369 RepID=A0AAV4LAZ1_9BACL|nr:Ger(x)C family spore germination protein [Collibacillus ludicampi]GIM45044.1 germination protein GerAC [Collibacillus ludicampi]